MAVDPTRGTKRPAPKKMEPKEKRMLQNLNDLLMGKKKKKNGAK